MNNEQRCFDVANAAMTAGAWTAETGFAFVAQANGMTEEEVVFWEEVAAAATEE